MDSVKTGLFFGSFNPVHTGHLIIAQHFVEQTDMDQVWFVLSPQNPFKKDTELLDENGRRELLELAIQGNPAFALCDAELTMSRPSYTIRTVKYLMNNHPGRDFRLIIGSDNLEDFHQWKDYRELMDLVPIVVYPRPGVVDPPHLSHPRVTLIDAPLLQISSSSIRQQIASGRSPRYLLPDKVLNTISARAYYKGI